jgi:hypothetical protein
MMLKFVSKVRRLTSATTGPCLSPSKIKHLVTTRPIPLMTHGLHKALLTTQSKSKTLPPNRIFGQRENLKIECTLNEDWPKWINAIRKSEFKMLKENEDWSEDSGLVQVKQVSVNDLDMSAASSTQEFDHPCELHY